MIFEDWTTKRDCLVSINIFAMELKPRITRFLGNQGQKTRSITHKKHYGQALIP